MTVRTIKVGVGRRNAAAGERHYNAKLTDHEVALIVELYTGGMSAREIAEKFEIAVRTVFRYVSGEQRVYVSYRIITVSDRST